MRAAVRITPRARKPSKAGGRRGLRGGQAPVVVWYLRGRERALRRRFPVPCVWLHARSGLRHLVSS